MSQTDYNYFANRSAQRLREASEARARLAAATATTDSRVQTEGLPSPGSQVAAARLMAESLKVMRDASTQLEAAEAAKQAMLAMRGAAAPDSSTASDLSDEQLCAIMDEQFGPGNASVIHDHVPRRLVFTSDARPKTDEEFATQMEQVFPLASATNGWTERWRLGSDSARR